MSERRPTTVLLVPSSFMEPLLRKRGRVSFSLVKEVLIPNALDGIERDGGKHRWWADSEEEAIEDEKGSVKAVRARLNASTLTD